MSNETKVCRYAAGAEFILQFISSVGVSLFLILFSFFSVNVSAIETEWTAWLDRDNPSGSGDWETLGSFDLALVCQTPWDIECETLAGIPWQDTGEVVTCSRTIGFVCKKADQSDGTCFDYRVRFLCPITVDPNNPDNPVDVVGHYHNLGLDYVKRNLDRIDSDPLFRSIEITRLISEFMCQNEQEILDALQWSIGELVGSTETHCIVSDSEFSHARDLFSLISSGDLANTQDFVLAIKYLEDEIIQSDMLSVQEKITILSATSMARHSRVYWDMERDTPNSLCYGCNQSQARFLGKSQNYRCGCQGRFCSRFRSR